MAWQRPDLQEVDDPLYQVVILQEAIHNLLPIIQYSLAHNWAVKMKNEWAYHYNKTVELPRNTTGFLMNDRHKNDLPEMRYSNCIRNRWDKRHLKSIIPGKKAVTIPHVHLSGSLA